MSNTLQEIREKCEFVAHNAKHVRICFNKISDYVNRLPLDQIVTELSQDVHFIGQTDEETAAYVLTLDSINFGSGFFGQLNKREGLSGYQTIAQCLKEKFIENSWTAQDLANITANDCAKAFEQDLSNPTTKELMAKFAIALNEMGQHIITNYNGSFTKFIEAADHSAEKLVGMLAKLPCFDDTAKYQGIDVPIYKRAQITVADLHLAFQNKGLGYFRDIDHLTIFADNVVPHVLRMDDLLEYSNELAEKIDSGEEIEANSDFETELRACSIHCVERILEAAKAAGHEITSMNIDHLLWDRGHQEPYRSKPRHRTKSFYY